MLVGIILTACLVFATANAADKDEFSYDEQNEWSGVCVNDNTGRQSPIDIVTEDVRESSRLTELRLGDGWRMPISGTYRNNGPGKNVQFDPTDPNSPSVVTTNYLGNYRVLQMHMHWGANNAQGSEHTVNGNRYPLEYHFVHQKIGEADSTIGDNFAVIGVFAEAVDMPISGVWEQLNISAILSFNTNISVSGLNYSDLLPSSLDYYHYPGSLTTPGCDEVVQWFVLKEPIKVPSEYLTKLRMIETEDGSSLTLNFRNVLPLGERMVETPGSGSPKLVASALSILMAVFMTLYFS